MISTEELWREMHDRGNLIAGPWVPYCGFMVRYNVFGSPIAQASSQQELSSEDTRLVNLGYELTDQNRVIPTSMWDNLTLWRLDNE